MGKLIQFPDRKKKRGRVRPKHHRVRCQVSERWLQFPDSASKLSDGTYIIIDVMTRNEDEKEKKLCELVLLKEDLLNMLNRLPTTK